MDSNSTSPHPNPRFNLHPIPILFILTPIIILLILIAIILLAVKLRRLKSEKTSSIADGNSSDTALSIMTSPGNPAFMEVGRRGSEVEVFTYKDLEMATHKFSQGNVIGNGGCGVVYRGVLMDGRVAAIKVLNNDGIQGERGFRTQVDLLSRLHSPYLVNLLGYCADQHHRILVFEFMTNGTLQNHLTAPPREPLNWNTRLRIALDCARALEYLHERASPSIIHRDFKCTNVLLDRNFRAKVSDFGLAKMGSERINGQVSTRVLGTTGYLAPEYVSTGRLTTKSDAYSFGVVLLQLLTGRVPIDTKRPPGEHVLVSWALPRLTDREKVEEMVDPDLRGQYSKKDLIQVAAIAAVCVQAEADYRPLMTDVVQSLIPLVKKFPFPSNSSRFSSPISR